MLILNRVHCSRDTSNKSAARTGVISVDINVKTMIQHKAHQQWWTNLERAHPQTQSNLEKNFVDPLLPSLQRDSKSNQSIGASGNFRRSPALNLYPDGTHRFREFALVELHKAKRYCGSEGVISASTDIFPKLTTTDGSNEGLTEFGDLILSITAWSAWVAVASVLVSLWCYWEVWYKETVEEIMQIDCRRLSVASQDSDATVKSPRESVATPEGNTLPQQLSQEQGHEVPPNTSVSAY